MTWLVTAQMPDGSTIVDQAEASDAASAIAIACGAETPVSASAMPECEP